MKAPRPRFRDRDAESRRAAQAAAARKKRLPAPPPEPAASPGDAPDPAGAQPVDITDEAASLSSSGEDYTHPLAPPAVQLVQQRLRQQGAYNGRIDGRWGPETQAALVRFQQTHGLQVTGQLNQATVASLAHYNAPTIQQPPQPWLGQAPLAEYLPIVKEIIANQLNLSPEMLAVWQSLLPAVAQAQQRPAAYRFELRDGKIGVLPEPPEPRDREFAVDTYDELVGKAQELQNRLTGTNSARRVCNSVDRLLLALGSRFDDLRPGLLLSRSRSLEADRAAFADELLPDAVALMDDALQTLRDLLAAFPIVRHIEAEGLALQLDRHANAIPAVQQEMNAVKIAAARSGAVTEDTLDALAQNDAAIEEAFDPVAKTGLIADKLLVVGNLARAVLGGVTSYGRIVGTELGEVAGKSWRSIKDDLPKGFGTAARVAPLVGLVTLAGVIGGPMGSIAAVVPVFKPIADTLRKLTANILKDAAADDDVKGDHPKAKGRGKSR